MSGYTPDKKLRLHQLRELRRRWLKDQELSPRGTHAAPSGGGGGGGPMEQFWSKFLQDGVPWKNVIYKTYQHSSRIFTGDTILATGEVIPLMKEFRDQHH
uniref:NADH dehydrogenase [ubiquinone] 1 beta subcomplex subunit 6 n=1 Tax=Sus scrofa TaxID=9823 RepID=A0A8D0PPM0_PIG